MSFATAIRSRTLGGLPIDSQRLAAGVLLTLLVLSALVVATRRIAGALREPLAWQALLLVGITVAAATWAIRRLFSRQRKNYAIWLFPTALLLILAASLSLPGTSYAGIALLWGTILIEEAWTARKGYIGRRGHRLTGQRGGGFQPANNQFDDRQAGSLSHVPASKLGDIVPETPVPTERSDAHIVQQMVRSQAADGCETITGSLSIDIVPGQRTAIAHLAFCPPFAAPPEFSLEQIDGPAAGLKVAQLLPHGVRLEARLSEPAANNQRLSIKFAGVSRRG